MPSRCSVLPHAPHRRRTVWSVVVGAGAGAAGAEVAAATGAAREVWMTGAASRRKGGGRPCAAPPSISSEPLACCCPPPSSAWLRAFVDASLVGAPAAAAELILRAPLVLPLPLPGVHCGRRHRFGTHLLLLRSDPAISDARTAWARRRALRASAAAALWRRPSPSRSRWVSKLRVHRGPCPASFHPLQAEAL